MRWIVLHKLAGIRCPARVIHQSSFRRSAKVSHQSFISHHSFLVRISLVSSFLFNKFFTFPTCYPTSSPYSSANKDLSASYFYKNLQFKLVLINEYFEFTSLDKREYLNRFSTEFGHSPSELSLSNGFNKFLIT